MSSVSLGLTLGLNWSILSVVRKYGTKIVTNITISLITKLLIYFDLIENRIALFKNQFLCGLLVK